MIYDINGNPLASGGEDLSGYTMEQEPSWDDGKVLYVAHSTNPVGYIDASTVLAVSDFVPVRGRNSLFIMLPVASDTSPVSYGMAFYDAEKIVLPMTGTTAFWGRGTGDARARLAEVFVPEKAEYFRTTWWTAATLSRHPETPAFTYTFTPGRFEDSADNITHERPLNRGMLNAIRRARQLTDIKWTPKVKCPRYCMMDGSSVHFLDWCDADTEYVGVPYSGSGNGESWNYNQIDPNKDAGKWGYYKMFVGKDISIETFVTAARYPNSIFGTRQTRSTANYDASIYGDVCTALLFYFLGLEGDIWPIVPFMSSTAYGANYFNRLGALGTDVLASDIRLGDVFHNSGHVSCITDITRDASGNVTAVEISEATTIGNGNNGAADGGELGGMCRRKAWPIDTLMTSYWATNYTMYRYKNFTNIGYTRSRFVDTGNEFRGMPIVDLPCIPYLGNRAKYKAGYILNSKVLIGATGFTTLVVTKDGESFGSFTLNGATEVSVGFSATGSYEAHLTGANNIRSGSCYWTVE